MKTFDTAEELNRLNAMTRYEAELYASRFVSVAGVDEVGRGPLAGPVMACAVILPQNARIFGVDDSKKLSAKKRETLAEEIKKTALCYALGLVEAEEIDEINILQATYRAMSLALAGLSLKPDAVLVDGPRAPELLADVPQTSIIKGDSLCQSIAAASILAKVTRDALMKDYHEMYPRYGFAANKGYGTAAHMAAIREHGLCPIHRRSFTEGII